MVPQISDRYEAVTDSDGNSNTITINFTVDDTNDPVFNSINPSYTNSTGVATFNGNMSEECTVSNTSGSSNTFTVTTSTILYTLRQ